MSEGTNFRRTGASNRLRRHSHFLLGSTALAALSLAGVFGSPRNESDSIPQFDDPAIQYETRPTSDPVSTLNREIKAGEVRLKFDGAQGYLQSVLDRLNVPVQSQIVVFSKTSVQARLINPQNPRTLFYNDSVTVGWVHGGFVELAVQDPQQGIIFYSLEQRETDTPQFERRNDCLQCHDSNSAAGIPGMLVRSEFTAQDGSSRRDLGEYAPDHRTPFDQRWGGWYVTGTTGSIEHMGNAIVTSPLRVEPVTTEQTLNLKSLNGRFNTDAYLSPHSDVVSLLVFDVSVV